MDSPDGLFWFCVGRHNCLCEIEAGFGRGREFASGFRDAVFNFFDRQMHTDNAGGGHKDVMRVNINLFGSLCAHFYGVFDSSAAGAGICTAGIDNNR